MSAVRTEKLDRRVALLRFGLIENEHGDDVQGFAPMAVVWASVKPAPGTERLQSAEAAAAAPLIIWIRWWSVVADLNAKDRLEYPVGSGCMFDIKSVNEIGRREGLEIAAVGRGD